MRLFLRIRIHMECSQHVNSLIVRIEHMYTNVRKRFSFCTLFHCLALEISLAIRTIFLTLICFLIYLLTKTFCQIQINFRMCREIIMCCSGLYIILKYHFMMQYNLGFVYISEFQQRR